MISIDYGNTNVIFIPQSYLTFVSGTLYELDTNAFRIDLKLLESGEEGIVFPDTNRHNTEVSLSGTTFARIIEILAPYSVTFENMSYSVNLLGSNNNIFDIQSGILNQNLVQVIPNNSGGLVVGNGSGSITEQDKLDIADRVWDESVIDHQNTGSFGQLVGKKLLKLATWLSLK